MVVVVLGFGFWAVGWFGFGFWFFCFFGYLPVKMSRIVLAGFLGAEVPKDNIKTYPKCEGI